MFRNYITIAFRNIWKHKFFSFINISGLAIGISASLVIFLIVQYDFSFDEHPQNGDRISRLLNWATGLAIFISCLGLLGLDIFVTNQRTKEIGIRKVIGASVTQIVSLLSRDFLKLVMIAFLIAIPIAWWGIHTWLENFAFKTNMSWWIFMISGVLMVIIAMVTLGIQTIRSAMANRVKSLRSE